MDSYTEHIVLGILITAFAGWVITTFKRSLATREELTNEITKLKDTFNKDISALKEDFNKEITDLKITITELTVIIKQNFAKEKISKRKNK